jgi:hypothetical protein
MLASCTWRPATHGPAELKELPGDGRTILEDFEVVRKARYVGERVKHRHWPRK